MHIQPLKSVVSGDISIYERDQVFSEFQKNASRVLTNNLLFIIFILVAYAVFLYAVWKSELLVPKILFMINAGISFIWILAQVALYGAGGDMRFKYFGIDGLDGVVLFFNIFLYALTIFVLVYERKLKA